VGLSGGKDSLLLLYALNLYRRFSHKNYNLCAITVHPGLGFDPSPLQDFCDSLEIPYFVHMGQVVETALSLRREGKSPCALCSRLRRGALCDEANERGYGKIALGHHRDDALETFWMSMFMEGRLNTLAPVTRLSRSGITMIRPFIFLREVHIKGVVKQLQLPVCLSICPYDGYTMREKAKKDIAALRKSYPNADEMMFRALRNTDGYNLWDKYRVAPPPKQGHVQNATPADEEE
jgi:tRNA 2-thiocytidine biosynthesis protein TtcA